MGMSLDRARQERKAHRGRSRASEWHRGRPQASKASEVGTQGQEGVVPFGGFGAPGRGGGDSTRCTAGGGIHEVQGGGGGGGEVHGRLAHDAPAWPDLHLP